MKAQNKAFHRTSHKVRRPVNADVGEPTHEGQSGIYLFGQ